MGVKLRGDPGRGPPGSPERPEGGHGPPHPPQPSAEEHGRGHRLLREGAGARDEQRPAGDDPASQVPCGYRELHEDTGAAATGGRCRRSDPKETVTMAEMGGTGNGQASGRGETGQGGTATLTKKDFASDQEVRWCPGCGDYAILSTVQGFLPELGVPPHQTVFVS